MKQRERRQAYWLDGFFLSHKLVGCSLGQKTGVFFDPERDDCELKIDPYGNYFQDEDQPKHSDKEDGSNQPEKPFGNQRQGKQTPANRRDRGK